MEIWPIEPDSVPSGSLVSSGSCLAKAALECKQGMRIAGRFFLIFFADFSD
jgi:hypothetical protein